ncbi:HNH endonuclease signature motif containing protein [Streptomyces sp. H27-C3]|uniref:HNH endonuclease signature motif containing protein n=1 Tax=Streptomyces sp. H27-C3 TaxID=3046305 RepID=UPI0024BB59AF|nr:HNH endonuclease signature motif containing protein [Streptomyces sp. H27-C3]MDJ0460650.1 HNH endonuclease signature motif containing protein [Streptomyces sp. H27-C3]
MNRIISPKGKASPPEHGDERLPVRFWEKTKVTESGCWAWTAQIAHHGYGRYSVSGSARKAHRVAYEALVGAIPDGLVIDHLCRVRHCVNPGHLEPVTNTENLRRGLRALPVHSSKTHCAQGHPFEGENLGPSIRGERRCRACQRRWSIESRNRTVQQRTAAAGGV